MIVERLVNDGFRWLMEPGDALRWGTYIAEHYIITRCGHGRFFCDGNLVVPGAIIPKGDRMFHVEQRELNDPGITGPVHLLSTYVVDFIELFSEGARYRIVEDAAVALFGGVIANATTESFTLYCPPANRIRLVIASDADGLNYEVREPLESLPAAVWDVEPRTIAVGVTAYAGEVVDMIAPPGGGEIEVSIRNITGADRDLYIDCGWVH